MVDKYNNQVDKVETEIGKLPPLPENAYFSGLVREYDSVVKLKDEFSKSGGGGKGRLSGKGGKGDSGSGGGTRQRPSAKGESKAKGGGKKKGKGKRRV